MPQKRKSGIGRRLMAGIIAAAPLVVSWVILAFLFEQLARVGRPLIVGLAAGLRRTAPPLADLLMNDVLLSLLGAVVVVFGIYLLGWFAERVVGRRIIAIFDALVQRIPLVDTIYRATQRFLEIASSRDEKKKQRVVLISFPSPEMKTVGLLTQTLTDSNSGEELAVVYVPTTPNPTSGYLEIMPMKNVVLTDWSFEQAMGFIVTAGSNSPGVVNYHESVAGKPAELEK